MTSTNNMHVSIRVNTSLTIQSSQKLQQYQAEAAADLDRKFKERQQKIQAQEDKIKATEKELYSKVSGFLALN